MTDAFVANLSWSKQLEIKQLASRQQLATA